MGACDFHVTAKGKTAREAFNAARDHALYESGHGGYSGTIAEKHGFVMITPPEGPILERFIMQLIEDQDERIGDKWGPAGCIKDPVQEQTWHFFGMASS